MESETTKRGRSTANSKKTDVIPVINEVVEGWVPLVFYVIDYEGAVVDDFADSG